MRFQVLALASFALLTAEAQHPGQDALQVRYLANAGMLVTMNARRFLIDAPVRDGIAPYPTVRRTNAPVSKARVRATITSTIRVTHWHDDHFSAEAVAAHLNANDRAVFVSAPQVVDLVRAVAPGLSDRLRAVLLEPDQSREVRIGNVPMHVLRIRHNPSRRFPEQHVGFLIGDSTTVLHVGDADPKADNFAPLRGLPKVDVGMR